MRLTVWSFFYTHNCVRALNSHAELMVDAEQADVLPFGQGRAPVTDPLLIGRLTKTSSPFIHDPAKTLWPDVSWSGFQNKAVFIRAVSATKVRFTQL